MIVCRRLCDEGTDMRSYIMLPTGVPFFTTKFFIFTVLFVGWLTALCRPQVRGRQCAVIMLAIHLSLLLP